MKLIQFVCATIFMLAIFLNGQTNNSSNKLLGVITKTELTNGAYATWFYSEFDSYTPDAKTISTLEKGLSNYTILVFMGTWCGDSRKEVPRLYKILEAAKYPMQQLKVVAVDNDRNNYKKSPTGEEKELNIHRVPTFIFYRNGNEINRIVEHPIETLEKDINTIISTTNYKPKYHSIEILQKLLDEQKETTIQIAEKLKPIISSETELNGLGYFYLNDKNYEKAISIFTINNLLFPNNFNTYDSLAEAYETSGEKALALKNYELAFSLIQQNPTIVQLKNKIENLKKN